MDSEIVRGATTFKQRAKQGRDFTGLRYGNITPTDLDGLIEFRNECYVFIEAKKIGAEMPYGQKLALERLCDDMQKVKPTLLIVISHDTPVDKEIDFANSCVEKYRYKGRWAVPQKVPTAKQLIDLFIQRNK